jgi:probable rRNA maturation factor
MKTLQVFNRQKTRAVDLRLLRQSARCLANDLLAWQDYQIAVYLIDPIEMSRLHETFLKIPGSTDVITFDYRENPGQWRGEIFISVADAERQARQFRAPWQEELLRYVIHGMLHLAGYDDTRPALRRVMKRRENKLLKDLSRLFVLRKLERPKHVRG